MPTTYAITLLHTDGMAEAPPIIVEGARLAIETCVSELSDLGIDREDCEALCEALVAQGQGTIATPDAVLVVLQDDVQCAWFARCDREATTVRHHPVLDYVPICGRCDSRVEALGR